MSNVCIICKSGGNIPFINRGPRLRPFVISQEKFDILKKAGYKVEIVEGMEVDEQGRVKTSSIPANSKGQVKAEEKVAEAKPKNKTANLA